jgi:hypothetical protein
MPFLVAMCRLERLHNRFNRFLRETNAEWSARLGRTIREFLGFYTRRPRIKDSTAVLNDRGLGLQFFLQSNRHAGLVFPLAGHPSPISINFP